MGKGKRTTLAAFVKRQPEKQTIILRNDLPDNFYGLDNRQKRELYHNGRANEYILIKKTGDNTLRVSQVYRRVRRNGRRYYIDGMMDRLFAICNGDVFIENGFCNLKCNLMDKILKALGVPFDITSVIGREDYTSLNKTMLKSILVGTIYSEETFWKRKMNTSFHLKGVSWRDFRTVMQYRYDFVSIADLKDFTTNYAYSFRRVAKAMEECDNGFLSLVNDMLRYAVEEDSYINLKWSKKRMEAEHQAQIERKNIAELEEKSVEPIFGNQAAFVEDDGFSLINSEREVYMEASEMHNCLHSCYFRKMEEGNYMAFRFNGDEKSILGVARSRSKEGKGVVFDQMHTKFNGNPLEAIRQKAYDFVQKNEKEILRLMDIAQKKATNVKNTLGFLTEEEIQMQNELAFREMENELAF